MTLEESSDRATVIVIDDDESLRASLASLFQSIGLKVRTFSSPNEYLKEKLSDRGPTCMVLDVRLPGISGLDFQAELARRNNPVPIIFMTGHGDIPMTVRAMKAGATEFLTKPFRDQDMIDAVQLGLERDRTRREADGSVADLRASYNSLSAREQEILDMIMQGLMNKQIAGKIGLSEVTVKVHRGNMMRKMGAKTLVELVQMGERLGLRGSRA